MDINTQSATLICLSLALLGVFPESPWVCAVVVAAIVLFGFLQFLTRQKVSDLEGVHAQIKEMEDVVDNIRMTKGMGR